MFTLKPVEGKDFVDRKEILEDILSTLSNKNSRIGFALYGRRRLGKTSILKEVCRRLRNTKDIVPVYISLWELENQDIIGFVRELTAAIVEGYGRRLSVQYKAKELLKLTLSLLKTILKNTKISLKIKDEIELLLTLKDEKLNIRGSIKEAFDLAEELAKETKTKCVIVIDEFPSIMELKNGTRVGEQIVKNIRTIQEDQKNTVLCISGSIRKTMECVAISPVSAFYKQFIIREVKPIENKYIIELLNRSTDKKINEDALKTIVNFCRGIPFYAQIIGDRVNALKDSVVSKKDIEDIIDYIFDETSEILFNEEFKSLGTNERKVIIAMAVEKVNKSADIKKYYPEVSNPGTFLQYLQNKGIVTSNEKGVYEFDDPVFEEWIKRKFG